MHDEIIAWFSHLSSTTMFVVGWITGPIAWWAGKQIGYDLRRWHDSYKAQKKARKEVDKVISSIRKKTEEEEK